MSRGKQTNPAGKKAITEALFTLMEKKAFSTITVTEIIEKAQVARATYYRNYFTKEDIIKDFLKRMKAELMHDLQNTPIILEDVDTYLNPELLQKSLELALTLCYKNQFYLIIIVNNGLGSMIQDTLNEYAAQIVNQQDSNERYKLAFFHGAAYNIVIQWLLSGAKESPSIMTEKLIGYLHNGVL